MGDFTAHSIDGDIPMDLEDLHNPGTDWSDTTLIPVTDSDTEETVGHINPMTGTFED